MRTTVYERGRILHEIITEPGPDGDMVVKQVAPDGRILQERKATAREVEISEAGESHANRFNEWNELESLVAALPSNNLSKPIFERLVKLLRSRFYEG